VEIKTGNLKKRIERCKLLSGGDNTGGNESQKEN